MKIFGKLNESTVINLNKFGLGDKWKVVECEAEPGDKRGDFDLLSIKDKYITIEFMCTDEDAYAEVLTDDKDISVIYTSKGWASTLKVLRFLFEEGYYSPKKENTNNLVDYILEQINK